MIKQFNWTKATVFKKVIFTLMEDCLGPINCDFSSEFITSEMEEVEPNGAK